MADRPDLASLLRSAGAGSFPVADSGWSRAAPWLAGLEGVVAFTGHSVMVVDQSVSDAELAALGVDGLGGAHDPRVAVALAGAGQIEVLDTVLVRHGTGEPSELVPRPDLAEHPRVRHARAVRREVQVWGLPGPRQHSVLTLARGIAGLPEISIETSPPLPSGWTAGRLLHGALALVPVDELVLACVSPGNARSVRLFLRCGFVPVGSVQLWRPQRRSD